MFAQYTLENESTFDEFRDVKFEDISRGREGAVLVDCKDGVIPIVRTTTSFSKPAQAFSPIHYSLIESILRATDLNLRFNNALVEKYDSNYTRMGFHSDQALDLVPDSYIAIYSYYSNWIADRTLQIKDKLSGTEQSLRLEHHSVVIFSLSTNSKYLHRIMLDDGCKDERNRWFGITFRLSKTFIRFVNELPYFDGKRLTNANEDERREYYAYRSDENKGTDYIYPEVTYTISPSDLLEPRW